MKVLLVDGIVANPISPEVGRVIDADPGEVGRQRNLRVSIPDTGAASYEFVRWATGAEMQHAWFEAIYRRVAKLEATMDVELADRGGQWLEATPGAKRYYADGVEITPAEYQRLRAEQATEAGGYREAFDAAVDELADRAETPRDVIRRD